MVNLYSLTLQKGTAITYAIFGNFSAPKAQEIVVARGSKILELLRPDDETGKVQSILSVEVFGIIRCLAAFRLVGGTRDYIICGTDSGKITILQYDPDKNKFMKIHEECFGKSGCRRIVPGQFLATDPKGRACMIAAIEKQKFVYVLNRDAAAALTISSPLEAHKSKTLTLSIVGVDVGFDNPVFAALEIEYENLVENEDEEMKEADIEDKKLVAPKFLTYYELDLGLNNVTRKWTEQVDDGCNLLVPVPGGTDGPGGVLVCAENMVFYKDQDHETIKATFPRRYGMPDEQAVLIVSYATHTQKNLFFFLLQSEYGDIYKVTLTYDDDQVEGIQVKYFDTLPTSANLCVLKTGFLFAACESSNHYLFQFTGIGDDDDETPMTTNKDQDFVYFQPRALTNLALIDDMESLNSIQDMMVADLTVEHTPQIYTLCGRASRSSLRVLRHGLAVTEMAVSELPGNPNRVWAVKKSVHDPQHSYIVVSFVNATIVLAVGETVAEVNDSGILDSTPTLSLSLLGADALLQIHPAGIRLVRADRRINEWKTPGKKEIVVCAVNQRQVVIGLTDGELVYFELDKMGQLMDVHRKEMGRPIASLAIAPIKEGRQRGQFMVVGCKDNTVRVLSCDPGRVGDQISMQALPSEPVSLCLVSMATGQGGVDASGHSQYVYAGLQNGILIRSRLDETDGSLQDSRKRFLGTRPVKLMEVQIQGRSAVLALSSRSWLSYMYQGRPHMTPLSYDVLEYSSSFSSEQCSEGIVCISGNTLRIVMLERLGELFNQTTAPLRYTPRKFIVHPVTNQLVIVESDHNAYPHKEKMDLLATLNIDEDADEEGKKKGEGDEGDEEKETAQEAFVGAPQAGEGKWASCIRILDPVTLETTFLLELEDNEAAFSVSTVEFRRRNRPVEGGAPPEMGTDTYLAVGTVKDMSIAPQKLTCAYIHLYRFTADGLEFMHKTEVEAPVLSIGSYQQKLICGVGNTLRLYELGKRKLLRKCENKTFPTQIFSIHVQGDRIFVGDIAEGFFFCKYNKEEKKLQVFADGTTPRYLTAACHVDYDTMAGGDKFGNVFVSRLPQDVSKMQSEDPTGGKMTDEYGNTIASIKPGHKLEEKVQYHVADTVTAMRKAALVPGGLEVLFYATISGGLGMLAPFRSKEDVEFFTHLEMHMRQENTPLCGRDHLAFRSYYNPIKDCIDGDLCEMFGTLDYSRQQHVAAELLSKPVDVVKKLEEIRNRVL